MNKEKHVDNEWLSKEVVSQQISRPSSTKGVYILSNVVY